MFETYWTICCVPPPSSGSLCRRTMRVRLKTLGRNLDLKDIPSIMEMPELCVDRGPVSTPLQRQVLPSARVAGGGDVDVNIGMIRGNPETASPGPQRRTTLRAMYRTSVPATETRHKYCTIEQRPRACTLEYMWLVFQPGNRPRSSILAVFSRADAPVFPGSAR